MFTGLIEDLGAVAAVTPVPQGMRLLVRTRLTGLTHGASIAVDGACLTAIELPEGAFAADLSAETLQRTTLGALKPGDPMDKTTTLGPLSTESALVKLLSQVKRAVAEGATLVLGGKRIDRSGAFMQPTILADIKPGNPAFREEFFGPVALFFRVKNEEEAVALANDSEFGLGGSVFTKDVARGVRVASRIDTGMVFVNHPTWTTPDLPFGGIKNSGYGRELSSLGIQEFVNKKLVRVTSIDAPA